VAETLGGELRGIAEGAATGFGCGVRRATEARCADEGLPVRLIRGAGGNPTFSPERGFRYDGLYRVDRYWSEAGRSGFTIWRYRLTRLADGDLLAASASRSGQEHPARRLGTTLQRVVRNTAVGQVVKALYKHKCQICGLRIMTPAGAYAEAAHIRPLGRPHDGPDVLSNVLCLCPNDHVRFDSGAIYITEELEVVEVRSNTLLSTLRTSEGHSVSKEALRYHRALFGK
jgi:putative restriction endonuclease